MEFGTVRPRVQIPGPRPFSNSKALIVDVIAVAGPQPGHSRGTDSFENLATRLRSLSFTKTSRASRGIKRDLIYAPVEANGRRRLAVGLRHGHPLAGHA